MTGRSRALVVAALAVLAALAALAPVAASALEVTLATSRPEVAVGEQFTLSVDVRHDGVGSVPQPELPPVENVRTVTRYQSQGFSYVNGKATSNITVQYVMLADAEGTYTFGPVTVSKGKEAATSNTVEVTVRPAGSSATVPRRLGDPETDAPSGSEGDDLIVLGRIDDENPYVNEQITYSFTFLRRVRLLEGTRYQRPEWSGFWSEEIDVTEPEEVTFQGRRYIAERVRTALFPTAPGEYRIGPAKLRATVEEQRRRRRDPLDVFGNDPFGLFRSGREVSLQTDPVTVNVRPLPTEGKPADFSGAVGQFRLEADADRSFVKAGDAITLRVRLTGEGNVKVIPTPDVGVLSDFKIYESSAAESSRAVDGRILGTKTWEFVLVPVTGGDVDIPPVRMSVFDPVAEQYVTLATNPIPLQVEATDLDDALARGDTPTIAKERVRLQQRDIRYLKPMPSSLRAGSESPFTSPGFLLAHAVPLLALAGSTLLRRHRERLRSDVQWARRRGAARNAAARLKEARRQLDAGELRTFFGELSGALRGYVADRLHLAAANLDEGEVRARLAQTGAPPEAAEDLFAVLGACDSARFSPVGSDPAAAADLMARAEAWIRAEERR